LRCNPGLEERRRKSPLAVSFGPDCTREGLAARAIQHVMRDAFGLSRCPWL
jgi:hypothetical protein